MNGWKNYQTFNVALWINNDESLYRFAIQYANRALEPTYRGLIEALGYSDSRTSDDVDWISDSLDYDALDDMVRELVD